MWRTPGWLIGSRGWNGREATRNKKKKGEHLKMIKNDSTGKAGQFLDRYSSVH